LYLFLIAQFKKVQAPCEQAPTARERAYWGTESGAAWFQTWLDQVRADAEAPEIGNPFSARQNKALAFIPDATVLHQVPTL